MSEEERYRRKAALLKQALQFADKMDEADAEKEKQGRNLHALRAD
jgi:hypothetical protein